MRALVIIALFASGCGEILVVRSPPWADDAQLVIIVLDGLDQRVEAEPRLLEAGQRVEVTIPAAEEREILAYEYARDQRAADGFSRLVACGASFEPKGAAFPEPSLQYRSGLVGADLAEGLELLRSDRTLVPVFQIDCNPLPCEKLDTDDVALPVQNDLHAVVAIDESVAVVGTHAAGSVALISLFRVTGKIPTKLAASEQIHGRPVQLVYDGRNTIYGTADPSQRVGGNLFAVDLDGVPVPAPALTLGADRKPIARGSDGAIFVGGPQGLFEVVEGSTVARRVTDLDAAVEQLGVAHRDRMAVVNDQRTILFYDGARWMPEWSSPVGEASRFFDLAVDEDQAIAVGSTGIILRRNEVDGTWERFEGPPSAIGVSLRAVALLSNGRFVVAFDGGGLAIWNGQAWCETLEPLGKSRIVDFSTSPSRTRVFGVSDFEPVLGPKLQIVEGYTP